MNRRRAIGLIGSLAAWIAVDAAAQQKNARRIGFLAGSAGAESLVTVLRNSLQKLGYAEGRDFTIEHRWPKTTFDEDHEALNSLVQGKVDVILSWTTTATLAAKRATTSIPIVFVGVADPVASRIVPSLARPGSNVTGITNLSRDLAGKQIQLLMQVLPKLKRVGIVSNRVNPAMKLHVTETERALRDKGLPFLLLDARSLDEFEAAFKRFGSEHVGAVVVLPDAPVVEHRKRIAGLALATKLPTIFQREENVEAGGLLSYGTSLSDQVRQAAVYIDKIFKGAKPADLPVEQPERIKLIVNVKTAKALGIAIPSDLLVRADAVIQ